MRCFSVFLVLMCVNRVETTAQPSVLCRQEFAILVIDGDVFNIGLDSRQRFLIGESLKNKPDGLLELIHDPRRPRGALAPTGMIVKVADNNVEIIDMISRKSISFPSRLDNIRWLAVNSNGQWIAGAGYDGKINVWNSQNGRAVSQIDVGPGNIGNLVISPNGSAIVVETGTTVSLLDRDSGSVLSTLGYSSLGLLRKMPITRPILDPGSELFLRFSPNGQMIAGARREWADGIILLEAASLGKRAHYGKDIKLFSVFFSPDGRIVGGLGREASVYLWDTLTGERVEKVSIKKSGSMKGKLDWSVSNFELGPYDSARLVSFEMQSRKNASGSKTQDGKEGDFLWNAMKSTDACAAYQAISSFVHQDQWSVPFLRQRLNQVPKDEPDSVRQVFQSLESNSFEEREKASRELDDKYDAFAPYVQRKLKGRLSLEMENRLKSVIQRKGKSSPSPERLRELRSIEVLEYIDTPDAWEVLRKLAQGAPEAQLTREATAALERLKRLSEN